MKHADPSTVKGLRDLLNDLMSMPTSTKYGDINAPSYGELRIVDEDGNVLDDLVLHFVAGVPCTISLKFKEPSLEIDT